MDVMRVTGRWRRKRRWGFALQDEGWFDMLSCRLSWKTKVILCTVRKIPRSCRYGAATVKYSVTNTVIMVI